MATRNRILKSACAISFLSSINAQAFDVLKLNCVRQEKQGAQTFLSEIHFRKVGTILTRPIHNQNNTSPYEGEVLSYTIKGMSKKYISGYNLFSISYQNEIISGLTGDPVTHTDGSFSLVRLQQKNTGEWKFSYNDTHDTHDNKITAIFVCNYFNPTGL